MDTGLIPCPPPELPLRVDGAGARDQVFLSLVLPTRNEAENICPILEQLGALLERRIPGRFELVVVDDDSPDRTWEVATSLGLPFVRVVRRVGETGLSSAVIRGWQVARGEVLGVIDADLQHPPETLLAMLDELERGAELVVASRHTVGGGVSDWSFTRRVFSRGAQLIGLALLPSVLGRVSDPMSGYFLVRRAAIAEVVLRPIGYKILLEVVGRGTIRWISEVGYVFSERKSGASKVTFRVTFDYLRHLLRLWFATLPRSRFVRFGLVGLSGVVVDMSLLFLLSDPQCLGWGLTRSKLLAAEAAIISNFWLNDAWTFGDVARANQGPNRLRRFLTFNAICGLGLLINVVILNLLFNYAGMNRYLANAIAIATVTSSNYWLNTKLSWVGPKGLLTLGVLLALGLGCEERRSPRCEKDCRELGACTRRAERCVATSPEECRRAAACEREGRCVLVGESCLATEAECQSREACRSAGWCGVWQGSCAATERSHCAKSPGCLQEGRCTPSAGRCVVAQTDCEQSEGCRKYGRCTMTPNGCGIASSADCQKSELCTLQGFCSFERDGCRLLSAADCGRTRGCLERGSCTFVADTRQSGLGPTPGCLATKPEDCRRSSACRTEGACRLVEGVCGR